MISSARESNALLMRGAQVRSLHHPQRLSLHTALSGYETTTFGSGNSSESDHTKPDSRNCVRLALVTGLLGCGSMAKQRSPKPSYVGSNPTTSASRCRHKLKEVSEINQLRKWVRRTLTPTPLKTTMIAGGKSAAKTTIKDEVMDYEKVVMKSPTSKVGKSRFKP